MKTLQSALALALLAAFAQTQAQTVNDGAWRGTMGISTTLSSGNTDTRTTLINGDMASKTDTSKTSVLAYVNNASAAGVSTANRKGITGQYDYNLSKQLYAYGRAGLESDKVKDLSSRLGLGAGLGYHVINTASTEFDVYGGLGYSKDKYGMVQTIGGKTSSSFGRMELVLGESSTHKLSDTIGFKQKFELFNGLSGDKAKRYELSAGLDVALAKTISLNMGLMRQHNGTVAAGVKKNDTQLFTGINIGLGR
jgi:putative salt-induced outer membrane protein